jgi:hypothetical protein
VGDKDGVRVGYHLTRPLPPQTFNRSVDMLFTEASELLKQKHKDYGPKNIAQAPGGALNGLRVRLWDKQARINHLLDNGAEPENESLRDSFMDMANYALIAVMVLDGNWPGTEKP